MRTRRVLTLAAVAMIAGGSSGCLLLGPPRAGVVYVSLRPPAERVEVIPAAPGAGFVWIKGYWAYRGTDFAWVGGRWERPIEGRREWVADRWAHDRHGWYLVRGHWR